MADHRQMPLGGATLRAYLLVSRWSEPFLPLYLRRRLIKSKEDPARWREKLGVASLPRPNGPLVWMHAVGLGEVLALRGLITAMGRAEPDLSFLVTSSARSSALAFAGNAPDRTIHQFLPLDAPGPVAAFLDHWRPDLSVWAEQDLWPRAVVTAHKRGIPLALINARMNERAFQSRLRFRSLYTDVYSRFTHISAQDAASARHLKALGAQDVTVSGSLKSGAGPLADKPKDREVLAAVWQSRNAWCVAPSHAADEAIAIAVQARLYTQDPSRLLVIAPRDPTRRDKIIAGCRSAGLAVAIRSAGAIPETEDAVYLADTYGEMGLWYRLCAAALIGGSLGETAGHNPWEAAHLGCAVLHGPNVANFLADYATLHSRDAAAEVADADALITALQDSVALSNRAVRAKALAKQSMAAMDALCANLLALLPKITHG